MHPTQDPAVYYHKWCALIKGLKVTLKLAIGGSYSHRILRSQPVELSNRLLFFWETPVVGVYWKRNTVPFSCAHIYLICKSKGSEKEEECRLLLSAIFFFFFYILGHW